MTLPTVTSVMPPRHVQVSYITEIVKLMLWFMHRLMVEKKIEFAAALADYVDIYRKTSYFRLGDPEETQRRRPAWSRCAADLEEVFSRHLACGSPPSRVEEEGLALLWPHLSERIDLGLPLVEYRRDASFGCFYYYVTGPVVDLHFTNTIMLAAPFKEPLQRARELYELVTHCRRRYREAEWIKCGTWLNAYAPFRSLFPESWKDTGEPKSYNSLGWWGQFVDHAGDIHTRNVQRFRATGEFPYPCTFHRCALSDLAAFLCGILERNGGRRGVGLSAE